MSAKGVLREVQRMSKVTVLGGSGGVGRFAVKTLASAGFFDEVVIADIDVESGREVASGLDVSRVSVIGFDADDAASVAEAIAGSRVVVNCVGPYYRYGPPLLEAVISAGIDYVDVCDDVDATEAMLAMDGAAKERGVCAIIGMGASPGLANLLVKLCEDLLLSRVETVDIFHAHGGEEFEGPAVIKHRFHNIEADIEVFLDGEYRVVRLFEESGQALEEDVDFRDMGIYRVYPYPHPEILTLPKHIKGVKRVTNRGIPAPEAYARLLKDMVRLGMTSTDPVLVEGREVVPREFATAFVLSRRAALMEEGGITEPVGSLKIVVAGEKDGESHTYIFNMGSRGMAMYEGTGLPAAMGAIAIERGMITDKGVLPPEAALNPLQLMGLVQEVFKASGMGESFPIYIEHIDSRGEVEVIDLAL
jgi:saccharopine dehydrogenase (NAD+, L-lysine forming)